MIAHLIVEIVCIAVIFAVAGFFVVDGLYHWHKDRQPIDYIPVQFTDPLHGENGCSGCPACLHAMFLHVNPDHEPVCPESQLCEACFRRRLVLDGVVITDSFDLLI